MAKLANNQANHGVTTWLDINRKGNHSLILKSTETLSQDAVGSLIGEEGNPVLQHSRVVWA